MSGWLWVVVFNGVTAAAYLGIVVFIVRGLMRTGQVRTNRLAVATTAIFITCAAHHVLHAVHLVSDSGMHGTSLFGGSGDSLAMMRESMGGGIDVAVTASTAVAGVVYLGLRRFYGPLVGSPAMFDDASEARYRQLAANLPHTVVFVVDSDMRFVLVEGAGLKAEGYDRTKMEGQLLRDLVPAEVFSILEPHYATALAGRESEFDSVSVVTGRVFRVRARPVRDGSGRVTGALVLSEDVTAEREARAERDRARAFRDAVLTASPDVTTVTEVGTGRLTWASRSFQSLLEGPVPDTLHPWDGGDRSGTDDGPQDAVVVDEDIAVVRAADLDAASLPEGQSLTTRYRVRGNDGEPRWLSRRSTPFRRGPSGEVLEVLSVVREVTDVVEAERELERAALQDSLTGLPNRLLLLDRIGVAIDRGEGAGTGTGTAVLFCDLDEFKRVNDTGGHAAGDAVLVEVARRLRSVLRKGDSIARVGGDEFVMVVNALPTELGAGGSGTTAVSVAERIRAVLTPPIVYEGREYVVSASVGMVLVRGGTSAQDVLRDADSAMYRAKQLGKDRVELFDDALRANAVDRAYIEQTLREALDPESGHLATLTVVYQPVYQLGSGVLVGFEALSRLRDYAGEEITPDRFIPIAEDTGLITVLGERVLDAALGMLVAWRAAHPLPPEDGPVTVAVNSSARQAQHVDMAEVVNAALSRHGLQPSDLIIELTESVLLESGSSMLRQLGELRAAGVGVSIDDFGTGYASLRYLATLPVNAVKIDRSFTATMTSDPTSSSIVGAIIALARDLKLGCVVEGIETVEQLDALPGSVQGQGYLLGRPSQDPSSAWSTHQRS